jgi:hypothetical protein
MCLVGALVTLLPLVLLRARGGEGSRRCAGVAGCCCSSLACIGFAYMAVEIAARASSRTRKPIHASPWDSSRSLFASGLAASGRRPAPARLSARPASPSRASCIRAGLLVGLEPLFAHTLPRRSLRASRSPSPRSAVAPMGMLFPLGVKLIAQRNPDLIPWARAANGCFSVFGIFGTRVAALFVGFSRALLVGLLVYGLVAGIALLHARAVARAPAPQAGC